jgi:hypothetical protein
LENDELEVSPQILKTFEAMNELPVYPPIDEAYLSAQMIVFGVRL